MSNDPKETKLDDPIPTTAVELPQRPKKTGFGPLLAAGAFMLVGVLTLIYLGRDTTALMNAAMPDTDLVPLLETDFKPTNDKLLGSVVVYHFWKTWCGPCRVEYPELYKLYQQYKDSNDVRFISVSCGNSEMPDAQALLAATKTFLSDRDIHMPIYADPVSYTQIQIAKLMAAGGFEYPMTIVVDRKGVVRDFWRGYDEATIGEAQEKIEAMLQAH